MLEQQNEDGSVELLERCRREWEICKNNKTPRLRGLLLNGRDYRP